MGYLIDSDIHGKVFKVIDTDNPLDQEEQDIIDEVAANGGLVVGEHYYYDATNFITIEADIQSVGNPVDVDLAQFTGYHVNIDLPEEMFTESQWIKEDSETSTE